MIGKKLGSYLIEAELGSGAMGVVYRGVRETGKTKVAAVKVISADQMVKGKALDRFIRESELLEKFRHPNIVRYLARGKSGNTFYYAMEYIQGQTLDKILQARGSLPWQDVARYTIETCDALAYAHEHSVVHRDLKPSNLMVTLDDRIILTDFGIAKALDATALTDAGRTLGTAAYMAPEQIGGKLDISHKTDLYALGVLMYQMLVGDLPFRGGSVVALMHMHMTETPQRPRDYQGTISMEHGVSNFPVELEDLILSLLAKSPADRPFDAGVVSQKLRSLLDRHKQGKPIPMVWPVADISINPTRTMEAPNPKPSVSKPSKKQKKSATGVSTAALQASLPTIGLVAALILVGGMIGYLVWPPSAAYLYESAKAKIASKEWTDRFSALEEYIDPLDTRFPDHPYKAETEAWRDEIALTQTERRAGTLESAAVRGLKTPNDDAEALFASVFPEADAARKRFDDQDAARRWRKMAESLEAQKQKSDRGWILLARKREADCVKEIAERDKRVADLVARAAENDKNGSPDQAILIRKDIVERFGKFTDQVEVLKPIRALIPEEKPEPTVDPPKEKAPDR